MWCYDGSRRAQLCRHPTVLRPPLQISVNGSWPVLTPQTYYHVVLAPGAPSPSSSEPGAPPPLPNGVYWCGMPFAAAQLPPRVASDPLIFTGALCGKGEVQWRYNSAAKRHYSLTGRQLVSQPSVLDPAAAYAATSPLAVAFLRSAQNWSTLGSRFSTWAPLRQVRYGLQIVGPYFGLASTSSETMNGGNGWLAIYEVFCQGGLTPYSSSSQVLAPCLHHSRNLR